MGLVPNSTPSAPLHRMRSMWRANFDNEVASGRIRGPLHGVPIILKDNIMTGDGMTAAAGAAALAGFKPAGDATLARRLRAAGALILGKANLTEFADYVSDVMPSGFSGAGGMVKIRTASSITGAASARAWGRRRQLPHRWRRSPSAARRRTRSKPRPACLRFWVQAERWNGQPGWRSSACAKPEIHRARLCARSKTQRW